MRFNVHLLLEDDKIPKDKNRLIMHMMKLLFEKTDERKYKELYEEGLNRQKDFTFSMYLGRNVEFLRDEIYIPEKRIILNFSTYDIGEGLLFYNSFIGNLGLEIPITNNLITIDQVNQVQESPIMDEEVIVRSKSPICVRSHRENDNRKTWYYSLSDERGIEILRENLTYKLKNRFPDIRDEDLRSLDLTILENKDVTIRHYTIDIPCNLSTISLRGRSYILDYLSRSGLGSRCSQGFGFVDII